MSCQEINTKRKEGLLDEALEMAEREYAANPHRFVKNALFWCLNDKLKKCEVECAPAMLERMKDLAVGEENPMYAKAIQNAEYRLSPDGQKEFLGWKILKSLKEASEKDFAGKKQLLLQYIRLQLPYPSTLHSCIMKEAIKCKKLAEDDFTFSAFAQMWGFNAFSQGDWEQATIGEGKKMSSIVEKAIVLCVKEMHDQKFSPTAEFQSLLEQAIEKFPGNLHLLRYKAQMLTLSHNIQQAVETYKKLIANNPDKFYLWDDLAELAEDVNLKIGLLCAAISTGANDEYLVNVRLQLAELLCDKQLYSNAKTELDIYKRAHEAKGWPLKRKYFNALNRMPADTVAADNRPMYSQYKAQAEEYIYSEYPDVLVVKNWEKKDKFNGRPSVSWQLRSETESFWLKPRKYGLNPDTPNGSAYYAKISNGQIVSLKGTGLPDGVDWLRSVEGILSLRQQGADGKRYGFIDDVFVPGQQLPASACGGAKVRAIAMRQSDGRWISLSVSAL